MINKILSYIDAINESIPWVKQNRPNQYESIYLQLVEERRKMGKIATAEQDNPAIAAYGKSQTGKSYLMSNILQKNGEPFLINVDGKDYNFINDMNPITKNTEATGVVTRFSSFSRNIDRFSPEHPIMMRTLSVSDIILVLSDGYYNDIVDYTTESESDITQMAEDIYLKYKSVPCQNQTALTPDDILEIKFYFKKSINNAQSYNHTDFFDKLALVIDRIPINEWVDVFSNLWHREQNLTNLFSRLLAVLQRVKFNRDVYLPVGALLHEGNNENTIMSVQCLNGLGDCSNPRVSDVFLKEGNRFLTVPGISKSELSAICAEVVLFIPEGFLDSSSEYCFDGITDQSTIERITHGDINKSILRTNDLLDFPGARSRLEEKSATLSESDILCKVLLRGKVAYLFNKYNEARVLNVLLYCHDFEQNDVSSIPNTLDTWVKNYVGDTPEKRAQTIQMAGGISPLFYIATKFNVDMQEEQNPSANERNAIDGRWFARFQKVLYRECFNADSVDWVKNWTNADSFFRNSYLLRDFKYSGEKASKLYDGFSAGGKELRMSIPQSHYDLLRLSFCESPDVKTFFADPAKSWDVAASINNDGSLYIIENLTTVANCLLRTRSEQFLEQISASQARVYDMLKEFHISDDMDKLLEDNVRKAKSIIRELDIACNNDNYYFGHLIQALQVSEREILDSIHGLIQGADLNDKNNSFKEYEIIRRRCGALLDDCTNDDERWGVIIDTYALRDRTNAEDYLKQRNIDASKLFANTFKKKDNSSIIADKAYDVWQEKIQSVGFLNTFSSSHTFDTAVMVTLIENILTKSRFYDLPRRMSAQISEFTNTMNPSSINESLVADILASTISDYIYDLGYSYLSQNDIASVKSLAAQYRLPMYNYIDKEDNSISEPEELASLFDASVNNSEMLTKSFENSYFSWAEYLCASFVSNLSVPDYDKQANDALAVILSKIVA